MNPFLLTDGYKTGHHLMYPNGTSLVYSNFTPRSNKYAGSNQGDQIVNFGQQIVVRYIKKVFDENFFSKPKEEVCGEVKREYELYLGMDYDVSHIEALHDLGYLPLKIKSLPEGTLSPVGVPVLTIYNTKEEFYWLTNFLETLISNVLWKPMTSATTAYNYRKILTRYAKMTNSKGSAFVDIQGHDFSMRGMDSVFAAQTSGLGHATSFVGSDSLPVIHAARDWYDQEGFVVGSVYATEHAVMCAGTGFYIAKNGGDWEKYGEAEIEVFKQLLRDFPVGVLSIVSDTWDLWKVVVEYLSNKEVKAMVLGREGTVVIRPDSGDPVDIVCGELVSSKDYRDVVENAQLDMSHPKYKGVVELLWDEYGGSTSDEGYRVLNEKIGVIYGDSITLERAEQICQRLADKNFASTNCVLGVGSFTYQFNTRDTWGFAMKATYCEAGMKVPSTSEESGWKWETKGIEIFKDPITDDGTKKSARGLLKVDQTKGAHGVSRPFLKDQATWEEEKEGLLQVIFNNGEFENQTTLTEIRERLKTA
jgi:nicotinamide phosphoribosyltransferase